MDTIQIDNTNPEDVAAQAKHEADMAAAADGLTEETTDRPDWLPEKFKTPEEMAASYAALEGKLGGEDAESTDDTTETAADDEAADDTKTTEDDEVKSVLQEAGVDFDVLNTEFASDGALSETSMKALADAGFPENVVNAYIAGQEALATQINNEAYKSAGGKEAFEAMTEWAVEGYNEAEITAFNSAMDGDAATRAQAITSLKSKYTAQIGNDGNLHDGAVKPTHGGKFNSWPEATRAMADPRYGSDPAYRQQIADKLNASDL